MSDENRRDAVVSLAVYPDTKEKWENASEEDPNADSLSQLVRVAVQRYLYERDNDSSGEISEEVHELLRNMNNQQEALAQRMDELKGQLTDVREAVSGEEVSPEIEALAEDVFEALPTEEEVRTDSVFSGEFNTTGVPAPQPGSIEWLSDQLDTSRFRIQNALEYLQRSTYSIKRTNDGIYYKEV